MHAGRSNRGLVAFVNERVWVQNHMSCCTNNSLKRRAIYRMHSQPYRCNIFAVALIGQSATMPKAVTNVCSSISVGFPSNAGSHETTMARKSHPVKTLLLPCVIDDLGAPAVKMGNAVKKRKPFVAAKFLQSSSVAAGVGSGG